MDEKTKLEKIAALSEDAQMILYDSAFCEKRSEWTSEYAKQVYGVLIEIENVAEDE